MVINYWLTGMILQVGGDGGWTYDFLVNFWELRADFFDQHWLWFLMVDGGLWWNMTVFLQTCLLSFFIANIDSYLFALEI